MVAWVHAKLLDDPTRQVIFIFVGVFDATMSTRNIESIENEPFDPD
jgi:hypothetical protein